MASLTWQDCYFDGRISLAWTWEQRGHMSGQVCAQGESPSPLSLPRVSWRETSLGVTGCQPSPWAPLRMLESPGLHVSGRHLFAPVSSGEGSVRGLEPSRHSPSPPSEILKMPEAPQNIWKQKEQDQQEAGSGIRYTVTEVLMQRSHTHPYT